MTDPRNDALEEAAGKAAEALLSASNRLDDLGHDVGSLEALQAQQELCAAIASVRELAGPIPAEGAHGWRTIESAPSDGFPVLVWGGRYQPVPQLVDAYGGWWRECTKSGMGAQPTHWQPLPQPPCAAPSPQPSPAAAPDVSRIRVWDEQRGAHFLQDQAAPDAAGLANTGMRCDVTRNPCGTDTEMIGRPCQCQGCRAARVITAQASEITEFSKEIQRMLKDAGDLMTIAEQQAAALAAKEAECDELTSAHADCLLQIAQLESRVRVLEHNLESARAALAGKSEATT